MATRGRLVATVLALAFAVPAMAAEANHHPSTTRVADDVPPAELSRGEGAPLALAISGLTSGYAVIGGGDRHFGVCWRGGAGPFAVTLRGPDDKLLVDETGIDATANLVVKLSSSVGFREGRYTVAVSDRKGASASGAFRVVKRSALPAVDASVAALRELAASDPTFAYEAYLAVAPEAYRHPDSDAAALANDLCHRPPVSGPA